MGDDLLKFSKPLVKKYKINTTLAINQGLNYIKNDLLSNSS